MNAAAALVAAVEHPADCRWALSRSEEIRAFPTNIVSANRSALYYLQTPVVEALQQQEIRVRACFEAGGPATRCAHEVTQACPCYTDLVPDLWPAAVRRVRITELGGAVWLR